MQYPFEDICLIENNFTSFGTHCWPSSTIFLHWLRNHHTHSITGKTIIELGAGTGLVSIWCSKYARKVYAHDTKPNCNLIIDNCKLNCISTNILQTIPFDWEREEEWGEWRDMIGGEKIDFLFGCDLMYEKKQVGNVLVLVKWLLQRNLELKCWITCPSRNPYETIQNYLNFFQLRVDLVYEDDSGDVPVYILQIGNAA